MALHEILNNRPAVNILKLLYDQEVVLKQGYTLKLSEVQKKLSYASKPINSAQILSKNGLLSLEPVEQDYVLSITEKGKHFIEVFDQLIDLMNPSQAVKKKSVSINYNLTDLEKNILVMIYKIYKETGKGIQLKILTEELYPYQDSSKKMNAVSRYVNKLAELKLVEKKKEGRAVLLKVTNTGFKVINEQYLRALV